MVKISSAKIMNLLNRRESRFQTTKKGKTLEDLVCYLFEEIPGLNLAARNTFDSSKREELDLVFWNKRYRNGLYFLPSIVAIECKNWERAVCGQQVFWFFGKLKNRNINYGILVARNGIAGDDDNMDEAHSVIRNALKNGITIIVITKKEIEKITDTNEIVKLLEDKMRNLMIHVRVK